MTEKQIAALDWAAKLMGYGTKILKDGTIWYYSTDHWICWKSNGKNPLTDAHLLAEVRAKFLEKFPHLEMEILHFIKIGKPITIAKIGTLQGYQSKGESENPLEAELMAMFEASK